MQPSEFIRECLKLTDPRDAVVNATHEGGKHGSRSWGRKAISREPYFSSGKEQPMSVWHAFLYFVFQSANDDNEAKERFQFAVVSKIDPSSPEWAQGKRRWKETEKDQYGFGSWGIEFIRCIQGHSLWRLSDDRLGTPLSESEVARMEYAYHGTSSSHAESILYSGLHGQRTKEPHELTRAERHANWPPSDHIHRTHGHSAPHPYGDSRCISGMRHDCVKVNGHKQDVDCMVEIDLVLAAKLGVKFIMSHSGAILTRGLVPYPCIHGIWLLQNETRSRQPKQWKCMYQRHALDPLAVYRIPSMEKNGWCACHV